jgi:uncharacterized protein YpmS
VSTEASSQLESRIEQNLNGQPGQPFILRMTDAELTSLLATKLAEYGDAPVDDVSVWFTRGKLYATGRLSNVIPVSVRLSMIASPRIQDGKVIMEIEEMSAGSVPLPPGALDAVTRSLNETIDELQLGVEVSAVEILEGEAIIQGTREGP